MQAEKTLREANDTLNTLESKSTQFFIPPCPSGLVARLLFLVVIETCLVARPLFFYFKRHNFIMGGGMLVAYGRIDRLVNIRVTFLVRNW